MKTPNFVGHLLDLMCYNAYAPKFVPYFTFGPCLGGQE